MPDLLIRDTDRDELIAEIADAVARRLRADLPDKQPTMISGDAMAKDAGVSPQTIARLAKNGDIPSSKVGRRRLYRRDDVLAALEAKMGGNQ